ncbi:MAG: queuosine precursor transporter [Dehalococcoidales bacterium]|nr:queuosine precursor transporter [Dehalococcoidales bacterium]
MLHLILWVAGITSFSLLGSFYVRKFNRPDALIAIYATFVILSQIIATKIGEFNLGFTTVTAPAAVLIYAVTYLLTDVVNERFGRRETQRMVFIAFACQVAMVFFIWLATVIKPAPIWQGQESWESIMGLVPRITAASLVAFLASENLDAVLFDLFKRLTKGRHLWMRNVFSSIPSLTADTFIFITIAFYGELPLLPLIRGQIVTKYLVGLIDIPFMYFNRWVIFGFRKDVLSSSVTKNN